MYAHDNVYTAQSVCCMHILLLSLYADNEELAPRARTFTPKDVGDFLASIHLDKYREAFAENDVGGDVLLEADCEFLNELGVASPLDCLHIMTLFPRQLQDSEPRLPISVVLRFLRENKFDKYIEHFEKSQIDGDMIMNTEATLMKNVFKEIGIGVVDRVKILSKFKTFASSEL